MILWTSVHPTSTEGEVSRSGMGSGERPLASEPAQHVAKYSPRRTGCEWQPLCIRWLVLGIRVSPVAGHGAITFDVPRESREIYTGGWSIEPWRKWHTAGRNGRHLPNDSFPRCRE